MECAQDYTFDEISVEMERSRSYIINDDVYNSMVSIFQDKSPLHIDDVYARASGYRDRVMHGAILQGFLSHFIGMNFPGKRSLILSVNINYHQPSYLGDEVVLTAQVSQKVEAVRVVVLKVSFFNKTSAAIVASGKVQVVVRDER